MNLKAKTRAVAEDLSGHCHLWWIDDEGGHSMRGDAEEIRTFLKNLKAKDWLMSEIEEYRG